MIKRKRTTGGENKQSENSREKENEKAFLFYINVNL